MQTKPNIDQLIAKAKALHAGDKRSQNGGRPFEKYISESPKFRGTTPLGKMMINDEFHHYMNPDTDTLWMGFAVGMRLAKKIMVDSAN